MRRRPLRVFKATPVMPDIQSFRLRHKHGALELVVDGVVMITNDHKIMSGTYQLGCLGPSKACLQHHGKKIPRGQAVRLQVRNPNGSLTPEFIFTRASD